MLVILVYSLWLCLLGCNGCLCRRVFCLGYWLLFLMKFLFCFIGVWFILGFVVWLDVEFFLGVLVWWYLECYWLVFFSIWFWCVCGYWVVVVCWLVLGYWDIWWLFVNWIWYCYYLLVGRVFCLVDCFFGWWLMYFRYFLGWICNWFFFWLLWCVFCVWMDWYWSWWVLV